MSRIFEALQSVSGAGAGLELPEALLESVASAVSEREAEAPPMPHAVRVALVRLAPRSPLLPFDGNNSKAGEQYRILRTKILHHPAQPRVLVVSSPAAGDGKTVTAINLAGALALKGDSDVLLVDADFRRAGVAQSLGLSPEPGLAGVLAGDCTLEDALVRIEQVPALQVLPAGRCKGNPSELLDSARWRVCCAEFRKRFSFTVLDTPPVASVADYELVQVASDGVVIVVRMDHTDRDLSRKVLESVPGGKLLGMVINCFQPWLLRKSHDYYYYYAEEKGLKES
jgi:receptor protein-tyrosine kinase